MSALRHVAAIQLRQLDDLLNQHSMAYRLAREAKLKGHREDWITLDFVSGIYHDASGLYSSLRSYFIVTEKFTDEETNRIATMPLAELRATDEFRELSEDRSDR